MRKAVFVLCIICIGCNRITVLHDDTNSDEFNFSHLSGIYDTCFSLIVNFDTTKYELYYTINGDSPTKESKKFKDQININRETLSKNSLPRIPLSNDSLFEIEYDDIPRLNIIKFKIFDRINKSWVKNELNKVYSIKTLNKVSDDLPFINITVPTDKLTDFHTGIFIKGVNWDSINPDWTGNYHERGKEWEKEAHFFYYNSKERMLNSQTVGIRAHGGKSRKYHQKGLRLYARKKYDQKYFHKSILGKKETDFRRLVLKPFASSWNYTGLEDILANRLIKKLTIDHSKFKISNFYLNGIYWGIYTMSEKIDKKFIINKYKLEADDFVIIENWEGKTQHGDNSEFLELVDFISKNDLSKTKNYQWVEERVDIENLIDYLLFEIFIGNYDWPANNMKCWMNKSGDKKWRWIFFDGDAAFQNADFDAFSHALSTKEIDWPTSPSSTLFFRKLLKNHEFLNAFDQRLYYFLDQLLNVENTIPVLDDLSSKIETSIGFQSNRFGYPESNEAWHEKTNNIRTFLEERKGYLLYYWDQTLKEMDLTPTRK
jgi:hypothetical protein